MKQQSLISIEVLIVVFSLILIISCGQKEPKTFEGTFLKRCVGKGPYARECGLKDGIKVDISENNTKWEIYYFSTYNDFNMDIPLGTKIKVKGIVSKAIYGGPDKQLVTARVKKIYIQDIKVVERVSKNRFNELEVKHDFEDIQDNLNQLATLFKAGEISIEEFVHRQDEFIESNPDFKKQVESGLAKFEAEWQAEAQAEFNNAISSADLRILASAKDRDVIAELWQLKREDNHIEVVWLLKATSSCQITGSGSGSNLINQLILDGNIFDAESTGGGNRWNLNGKSIRLPKPYGHVIYREFHLPNILRGNITFIITERIYFDGQSKDEGKVFTFKFLNVSIPEKIEGKWKR